MKLTALLFSPFAAAALHAQTCDPSEGPFVGAPATFSMRAGDGSGLDSEDVMFRDAGFHTTLPSAWSSPFPNPQRPDFTKAALFYDAARPGCGMSGCGVPTAPLDVDAMSVGLDIIPTTPRGRIIQANDRWASIVFSVAPSAVGAPGGRGATIRGEVASPGGAAADSFTYVFDGPGVPLPPVFVGRTMRSQDSAESALPLSPAGVASDIDAIDLNLPVFRMDRLVLDQVGRPEPTFYFSVSNATVANVPTCWWGGTTPSGATILRTRWSRTQRAWRCPGPFVTYADLNLAVGDDLTALAVDEARRYLLFSSTAPGQNPFMFFDYGGAGFSFTSRSAGGGGTTTTPTPLKEDDGSGGTENTSDKTGLLITDVVDALCTLDPGFLDQGAPQAQTFMFGLPLPATFPGLPYDVRASSFRTMRGTQPVLKTYLLGYPPSGTGGQGLLSVQPGGGSIVLPRATSSFCGDPLEFCARLPTGPVGVSVTLQWFAIRPPYQILPAQDVDAAHPMFFTLP